MIKLFLFMTAISTLIFSVFILPKIDPASGKTAWQLVCKQEQKSCHMVSYLHSKKQKIISAVSLTNKMAKNGSEITVGLIQLPLGLHIPSGVKFRIDKNRATNAKLIDCLPKGCRAIISITPKLLTGLKEGNKAHIIIKDSKSHKVITMNYPLNGFTQAWSSMLKANEYKLKMSHMSN